MSDGPVWDFVIVGAGTAGSVLANRLSANGRHSVLLLEAGPDYPPGSEPDEIRDVYPYFAANNWNHLWNDLRVWLAPLPEGGGARSEGVKYRQARIVGGGSSINGVLATRGLTDDYDGWAQGGAAGWGWHDVLPYFRRLETDLDFGGPDHGTDGPISISRVMEEQWPGFPKAVARAFGSLGYQGLDDQNTRFGDGWFPLALTASRTQRVSAAMGYLDAATRRRANLAIRPGVEVTGLVADGARIAGVQIGQETIRANEVVLCAGALRTPVLLQRAGIGAASDLAALGIDVIANLAGVGANLQEHPSILVSVCLAREARQGQTPRRHAQPGLRFSSDLPGMPAHDMYMVVLAKSAWHEIGRRIGTFFSWINKPYSTGWVKLDPSDPNGAPLVAFELLSDPRDFERMKLAFRFMTKLAANEELEAIVSDPTPAMHGAIAQMVSAPNTLNRLITSLPALLMDGPAPLRRAFVKRFIATGPSATEIVADEALLEETVRRKTIGGWHPCGTCRMGPADDPWAVVDPLTARVHGVGGLSVVDASIMPNVPRANTNLPTLMLAEKMADAILARG